MKEWEKGCLTRLGRSCYHRSVGFDHSSLSRDAASAVCFSRPEETGSRAIVLFVISTGSASGEISTRLFERILLNLTVNIPPAMVS